MSPSLNGATPAMGLSIVFHIAAIAGAGLSGHPGAPVETTSMEIVLETEAEPPPPPAREMPIPNEEPAPAKIAAVHHEALAVRAVAATPPPLPTEATPPPDAPNAVVSDDALPHFTIATSTSAATGQSLAKTSGAATAFEGAPDDDAPYDASAVDVPARPTRKVIPEYPFQARSSGLEATVQLEIVLTRAGALQSVRALNHPGHGFEEAAIAAARRTPFTPAMKRGRAVPVRMAWKAEFQLQ